MADQGRQGMLSPWLRKQRIAAAVPWMTGQVLDFGCGGGVLAAHVDTERYVGFEPDASARSEAKRNYPRYRFIEEIPRNQPFDTIVALAVIEHVKQPDELFHTLGEILGPGGRIVLTTPHPTFRKMHDFGARLGIFSRDASEEHETFLDRDDIVRACRNSNMQLLHASRFLYGANQLFVLGKTKDGSSR